MLLGRESLSGKRVPVPEVFHGQIFERVVGVILRETTLINSGWFWERCLTSIVLVVVDYKFALMNWLGSKISREIIIYFHILPETNNEILLMFVELFLKLPSYTYVQFFWVSNFSVFFTISNQFFANLIDAFWTVMSCRCLCNFNGQSWLDYVELTFIFRWAISHFISVIHISCMFDAKLLVKSRITCSN